MASPDDDRARWDARYASGEHAREAPSELVTGLDAQLPRAGRALDVAGGAGRHAIWLAARGLDVTLGDYSERALALAMGAAATRGLRLTPAVHDFERSGPLPGPWQLVVCCNYLHRDLFVGLAGELAPGGSLLVVHPTMHNLERHSRPSAAHLLAPAELPRLVSGLHLVSYDEAWRSDGRHVARALWRRADG